jgi:hypothetical protein
MAARLESGDCRPRLPSAKPAVMLRRGRREVFIGPAGAGPSVGNFYNCNMNRAVVRVHDLVASLRSMPFGCNVFLN